MLTILTIYGTEFDFYITVNCLVPKIVNLVFPTYVFGDTNLKPPSRKILLAFETQSNSNLVIQ